MIQRGRRHTFSFGEETLEGPALFNSLPAAPFMKDDGKTRPQRERDFDVTSAIDEECRTAPAAGVKPSL